MLANTKYAWWSCLRNVWTWCINIGTFSSTAKYSDGLACCTWHTHLQRQLPQAFPGAHQYFSSNKNFYLRPLPTTTDMWLSNKPYYIKSMISLHYGFTIRSCSNTKHTGKCLLHLILKLTKPQATLSPLYICHHLWFLMVLMQHTHCDCHIPNYQVLWQHMQLVLCNLLFHSQQSGSDCTSKEVSQD
jgi:hypothetical protein